MQHHYPKTFCQISIVNDSFAVDARLGVGINQHNSENTASVVKFDEWQTKSKMRNQTHVERNQERRFRQSPAA